MPEKFVSKSKYYRAFYNEMLQHWPNVTASEARGYAREYSAGKFGSPDFDWSEEAAREMARSYVADFGEANHAE